MKCPICNKEIKMLALDEYFCESGKHIMKFSGEGLTKLWQAKTEKLEKVVADIRIMVKENLHGHKYDVCMEDIEKRLDKHI